MSKQNYNNNNSINNNNNEGSMGKCTDAYCHSCHSSAVNHSCQGQAATAGHQANNAGPHTTTYHHVPPIQVTAKVLFGSVSAISALNAERKKKSWTSSFFYLHTHIYIWRKNSTYSRFLWNETLPVGRLIYAVVAKWSCDTHTATEGIKWRTHFSTPEIYFDIARGIFI